MIPAPSHDAAVVRARSLNENLYRKPKASDDVLCFAYAAPWPYEKDQHAKILAEEVGA